MPTSPARASESAPANSESTTGAKQTGVRIRSAPATPAAKSSRPAERAIDVDAVEPAEPAVVQVRRSTAPKKMTSEAIMQGIRQSLAQLTGTEPPKAISPGGDAIPEAFRPEPEEATDVAPQTGVRASEEPGAQVGDRRVSGTQGRGGRGPGSSDPGHRAPVTGRVEKSRVNPFRVRRGPKKTSYQKRFANSRPSGHHPLLNPWDLAPIDVRASRSGQERSIFRTRGFLISHLDFPMYRMLSTHNVSLVPTAFPVAPLWWPADWGRIPITLPWEISRNRILLVNASHEEAVWQEVYQKFLEQLAGGWDLFYSQMEDPDRLEALPIDLARAIVDAGGFSFCSGAVSSASFKKFLQLHEMSEETVPNQRTSKANAWRKIESLKQKEQEAKQRQDSREPLAARVRCDCDAKISRAVRRLGVEAQLLEAGGDEAPTDVIDDIETLTALTSAALTFSITADGLLNQVSHLLVREDRNLLSRRVVEALELLEGSTTLSSYLPSRFSSNLARLSSRRSRIDGRD